MTLALATVVTLLKHSCMGATTATNENSDSDAVEVASPASENRVESNATTAIIPAGEWLEMPAVAPEGKYPDAVMVTVMDGGERNYSLLYDRSTYTPMWVAYPLESKHMGEIERPSNWDWNPYISISEQVNLCRRSYTDSDIYSRGHLIPNASRNGIKSMQLQTFYVTNSVPQIQNGFNGGVWMHLESAVQHYAEHEPLYVTTGVIFEPVGKSCEIGFTTAKDDTKRVPVPNYFYKVVLRVERSASGDIVDAEAIGFWFEHRAYSDKYYNYAVSVDEVERLTGFDFFAALPDDIEARAERTTKNFLR